MCIFADGNHYETRTSGRCANGTEIRSASECTAAGRYFGLTQSASPDNQYKAYNDPPFCYYEGGTLKFNKYGSNTGYCRSDDICLCAKPGSSGSGSGGSGSSGSGSGRYGAFYDRPGCMHSFARDDVFWQFSSRDYPCIDRPRQVLRRQLLQSRW